MATESTFFDITLHKMICSKGDFSSMYDISHVHGQIMATLKRVNHYKRGTEIFIKHLESDVLLQDILEFVFPLGQVYQIRILLEFSGHCRGYCYVNFFEVESARKAMIVLCGKKVKINHVLVKMSFDNNRLEISSVSKQHTTEEVFKELSKIVGHGLEDIFFISSKDTRKDRLNCILTFNTHKNALEVRKRLFNGFELFGEHAKIDWAIPEEKIKAKRIYFEVPLPKLTKPELYEELITVIKPKHILNVFLRSGLGYITFENETVAFDSFKLLKNIKMFGHYFKLSFRKFYNHLPNMATLSSFSECSEFSDNQTSEEPISDSYSLINPENNASFETSGCSSFSSNESTVMPVVTTNVSQNPPMPRIAPNSPVPRYIQNSRMVNYGMHVNVPEHYQICGVPYPSPCDFWVPQYPNQNHFVEQPIRMIQLNTDMHNMPVNFFQMTQDFYKHFNF